MTDKQIASKTDFTPASRCGRGGFEISLILCPILYDDFAVLEYLEGIYVNPLGPFRRWINLRAKVVTEDSKYYLSYKKEFWGHCSRNELIDNYLMKFLEILRNFVNEKINYTDIKKLYPECYCSHEFLQESEKEPIRRWIERMQCGIYSM